MPCLAGQEIPAVEMKYSIAVTKLPEARISAPVPFGKALGMAIEESGARAAVAPGCFHD